MPHPKGKAKTGKRRFFSKEFKQEAVQMLLDGHSASSVAGLFRARVE
jgi:transposase-like protein